MSSSYKQAALRAQAPLDQTEKYRSQAQQLQELFPDWSNDDVHSLLAEVGGDVQLAVTRITDGHAEQWGSVTRKKDKKTSSTAQGPPKDSFPSRGDFRGGRGGRGGRGISGRVTATRARGGTRASRSGTNGDLPRSNAVPGVSLAAGWADVTNVTDGETDKTAIHDSSSKSLESSGWSNEPDPATASSSTWAEPESSNPGWGGIGTPSTWNNDTHGNGSTFLSNKSPVVQAKPSKTPATSKLSWAQIARVQEKSSSSPASSPAATVSLPPPVSTSLFEAPPPIELELETELEPHHQGWEEPTTVQPPPWDDEPQVKPPNSVVDDWLPTAEMTEGSKTEHQDALDPPAPETVSEQVPAGLPAQLQNQAQKMESEPPLSTAPKPLAPITTQPRPAPSTPRNSRYKTTDKPVVMPSSFGVGIEKVGMQFGSLSLGGDILDSIPAEPPVPEVPPTSEPSLPEPVQGPPTPQLQTHEPALVAPPTAQTTHSSAFQQNIPQTQPQHTPPHHIVHSQHPLPTSVSQPSAHVPAQAPSHPAATASPIQPFVQQSVSQQQALATHHMQQQQQQQQQQHQVSQSQAHAQHQQYAQHGLPTHIDPTQNQVQHSPQHVPQTSQPQQSATGHSSYFRQAETPYFHAPTPPAGQTQESPYGSFGPLGQQGQPQAQASHLSGFGAGDYGYGDSQRGFYESYAQQSGFGNRNILSHEDVKGIPAQQQSLSGSSLPSSNTQPSQQHPPTSQSTGQPQPTAGQGPQQGYPPPVPYYYNPYPQNQYYGSPYNSAYGVPQPFVKYPTMFPPGPPGPGTAPSPAAKQPANVQPQSSPYGQGLYTQQHPSASYDDIGYQHHTQQHQQLGLTHGQGVAASLPSTEYAKQHQQLYAGHNTQSFIGLSQATAPSSGPPIGQRTGGSPETAYKPYAPNVKDVGAGVGVGQAGASQGPQGRAGVQQPQHSQGAFYGGNRFASNATTGPAGQQAQPHQPQGQAPQGHLGYAQGGNDGNFYSYQPRQQGYWQ